jgi:CBS domain-containing protein
MKVADILRIKGSVVKTVPPHETALILSGQMRAEQIGALVVSRDGNSIEGIVSERDLAYGLATYGGRLPTIRISELMTKAVAVCSPEDSVTDVMKLMTMRRIRHVPVKDGDQLVGIISIGDVLKHRLGELEVEADVLRGLCRGCSALGYRTAFRCVEEDAMSAYGTKRTNVITHWMSAFDPKRTWPTANRVCGRPRNRGSALSAFLVPY